MEEIRFIMYKIWKLHAISGATPLVWLPKVSKAYFLLVNLKRKSRNLKQGGENNKNNKNKWPRWSVIKINPRSLKQKSKKRGGEAPQPVSLSSHVAQAMCFFGIAIFKVAASAIKA